MVIEILIPLIQRVSNVKLSQVQDWLVAKEPMLNAKKSNFVIFILDRDVILKIYEII